MVALIDHQAKKYPSFAFRREGLICLLIAVIILAVYWQVGRHSFVNYDDGEYVTENRQVQAGLTWEGMRWAFSTTHSSNWHPLTWVSHMLDCELYGLNPTGHHLTNVLFHILNSILLFLIFTRMTGSLWRSGLVAMLFAIHPIHVESVAWVAERKDVLSTFFWMLTMMAYLRYVERQKVGRYLAVVFFFVLGLMSKPMVITLPFVLFLLDYWPLGRLQLKGDQVGAIPPYTPGVPLRRLLFEKTPLFILAAASGIVTFLAQEGGGSVASLDALPIGVRASNALVSYISYLGKMIWPSGLAVLYLHPDAVPLWKVAGALALLMGISLFAIKTVRERPSFAVGWAWYIGTLVPVIGLVQVGMQAMADRYTYIPLIGIFVMIAWGIPEMAGRRKNILYVASAAVLSALMATTWLQLRHWKDSVTLFSHTAAVTEDNYVARISLGAALVDLKRAGEAVAHFREALRTKPRNAKAHYNLGLALMDLGRRDEAIECFREALRINPHNVKAHHNLGIALVNQGQPEAAVEHFREALGIDPDDTEVRNSLGVVLAGLGRTGEAMAHFREALRIKPYDAKTHHNLGIALANQGQPEAAVAHFHEALRIDPSAEAHGTLGSFFFKRGRLEEAVAHFREALRINPYYTEAQARLEEILAVRGKIDDASRELRNAIDRNPSDPALHTSLGLLYYKMGDLGKAAEEYRQVLLIDPDSIKIMNDLAVVYLSQGKDAEALSVFTRMAEIQPDDARHYYNIACLHARQGREEEALSFLEKAVEKGYDNWDLIRTDRDLDGIRKLPGYRRLVEECH